MGIGDWGLGVWGLGVGGWGPLPPPHPPTPTPQPPIPNPQSPIPNPHMKIIFNFRYFSLYNSILLVNLIIIIKLMKFKQSTFGKLTKK